MMPLALILTLLGAVPSPVLAADITHYRVEYSTTTAPLILQAIATKHGVEDVEDFIATAKCESRFVSSAIGDRGTSFGIFQIHLPAHKDVTKAQALDPWWAAEWAAHQFAMGNQKIWSCYRIIKAGALET